MDFHHSRESQERSKRDRVQVGDASVTLLRTTGKGVGGRVVVNNNPGVHNVIICMPTPFPCMCVCVCVCVCVLPLAVHGKNV